MMKDWRSIFQSTAQCQSAQERHWHAIACLKVYGPKAARKVFFAGNSSFQQHPKHQMLLCDIERAEGKTHQALQRHQRIDTRHFNAKLLNHYQWLKQKLSPSSPSCPSTQTTGLKDWGRQLQLFPESRQLHREHCLAQIQDPTVHPHHLEQALISLLKLKDIHYTDIHSITDAIHHSNHQSLWDFWITEAFDLAHRINPDPVVMWTSWWKKCPVQHQIKLQHAMRSLLQKQPNYRLEEWLGAMA